MVAPLVHLLQVVTLQGVNKAPSVKGQGFTAGVNPLSMLTHICTTSADTALQGI